MDDDLRRSIILVSAIAGMLSVLVVMECIIQGTSSSFDKVPQQCLAQSGLVTFGLVWA